MIDFEHVYKRHGENFIWDILENWERHHRVRHPHAITLEERWEHFIRATEPSLTAVAA